ncbi:MAG: hypothetical protein ACFFDN_42805 [Candidatus Hodarchaeota archaeon]
MPYSPPTKMTIIISVICLIIGFVLGIVGLYVPAVKDWSEILILIGLILCCIAWVLMFLGVMIRGI